MLREAAFSVLEVFTDQVCLQEMIAMLQTRDDDALVLQVLLPSLHSMEQDIHFTRTHTHTSPNLFQVFDSLKNMLSGDIAFQLIFSKHQGFEAIFGATVSKESDVNGDGAHGDGGKDTAQTLLKSILSTLMCACASCPSNRLHLSHPRILLGLVSAIQNSGITTLRSNNSITKDVYELIKALLELCVEQKLHVEYDEDGRASFHPKRNSLEPLQV